MEHHILLFSIQAIAETLLNEQIPEGIVYLEFALFVIWFVWLLGIWIRQSRLQSSIDRLTSLPKNDPSSPAEASPLSYQQLEAGAKELHRIIEGHIQSIVEAGKNQTKLDVSLLIKNTHDRLNIGSTFLRSTLSLFLILGLLGTLFGLAISLSQFSNALLSGSQITNEVLQQGLRELLTKLGGAFIPSIAGVLFTIIGVLMYSIFQRRTNIPLGNLIELKTLTEWVPKFIKTPRQKETEQLENLKGLIQENTRLAKENEDTVTSFKEVADTLKGEAGDLATNVKSAGKTLRILSESSQNLRDFSERFVESVGHITSFQEELKAIYEQNAADSAKFNQTIEAVLNANRELQEKVSDQFKQQSDEAAKLVERLRVYEEGYLESRKSIDANLNKLLETASDTYEKIGSRDEEIIRGLAEQVGKPLEAKLSEELKDLSVLVGAKLGEVGDKFGGIKDDLNEFVQSLGNIKNSIDAIQNPIGDAAKDIKGIATDFDKRTQALLTELQREFHEQNTSTKSQLQDLNGLKGSVELLSEQFDKLATKLDSFQNEAVTLGQSISDFRLPKQTAASTAPQSKPPVPRPVVLTRWERFKRDWW